MATDRAERGVRVRARLPRPCGRNRPGDRPDLSGGPLLGAAQRPRPDRRDGRDRASLCESPHLRVLQRAAVRAGRGVQRDHSRHGQGSVGGRGDDLLRPRESGERAHPGHQGGRAGAGSERMRVRGTPDRADEDPGVREHDRARDDQLPRIPLRGKRALPGYRADGLHSRRREERAGPDPGDIDPGSRRGRGHLYTATSTSTKSERTARTRSGARAPGAPPPTARC